MKIAQFLIIAAASLFSISETKAATIWSTTFTQPPYTLDSTIIGTQGWTASTIDSGENADARLVTNSNSPTGTALQVKSSSTQAISRRRTTLNNVFSEEVTGPFVQVKFSAAFETSNTAGTSNIIIAFHPTNAATPPFQLFYAPNVGIYLGGTYANLPVTTLVSSSQINLGAFYDFTFTLNYTDRTFDLNVTGVDNNNTALSVNLDSINFQSTASNTLKAITGIRIESYRGDLNTLYMGNISVESIPEPSTTISMLIGAAFAGTWMARKAGKKASAK